MKDNITPEEKLLRLIRGKKKSPSPGSDRKPKPRPKFSFKPAIQIHSPFLYCKRIIMAVFIASCVYLIFSFVQPMIGLEEIDLSLFNLKPADEQPVEIGEGQLGQLKTYEYYLKGIRGKQIFNNPSDRQVEKMATPTDKNLLKDINLVGIIGGKKPQAIIEDKRAGKTYYLSEGQFLSELQVEKIEGGKIILNHNGVRFELYL